MIINVDHKFRLSTDKTGWVVQQLRPLSKGPHQGQVTWAEEGHYDTLQWALVGLYRLMIHEGQGNADLLALAKRVEAVEQRINTLGAQLSPRIPEPIQQVKKDLRPLVEVSPWDRTGS